MSGSYPLLTGVDLTTLRLLVAVAEEGNLGRAAERENISISSVSRRIAELEARTAVPLLHRHDRGVTPTAALAEALPRIRATLDTLEGLIGELSEHQTGLRGTIRLRAHLTALAGPLPGLLGAFLDRHPAIEIEIEDASSQEAMHAVRVGTADLALVSGTIAADDLTLLPWASDEIKVILPPSHPLAAQATIGLADLLPHPFIGMQRDSALLTLFRHQASLIGGALRERARVTGFEMVRRLVAARLGVSIVPAAAARGDERIIVRSLAEPWARRPLMICLRSLNAASAAARLLAQHLRESMESAERD